MRNDTVAYCMQHKGCGSGCQPRVFLRATAPHDRPVLVIVIRGGGFDLPFELDWRSSLRSQVHRSTRRLNCPATRTGDWSRRCSPSAASPCSALGSCSSRSEWRWQSSDRFGLHHGSSERAWPSSSGSSPATCSGSPGHVRLWRNPSWSPKFRLRSRAAACWESSIRVHH